MAFDAQFTDGFDKYGPTGVTISSATQLNGEWTSINNVSQSHSIQAPLFGGVGYSYQIAQFNVVQTGSLNKTLPGNYARIIGGCYYQTTLAGNSNGINFSDGGTTQVQIAVTNTGQITCNGLTTTQTVSANTPFCLEWDITFHASAGIVKLYINGAITSINNTGRNTAPSGNARANIFGFFNGTTTASLKVDHLYLHMFLASGSADTPLLTNPIVETQYPSGDSSVQMTASATVLGQDYTTGTGSNAPGANEIFLRKFTPSANCTINSISIVPAATSATAKFKAVIYADSAGVPSGAALSSGLEVVGATNGVILTGSLVTPQNLTGGTAYWIGFITDTSVALNVVDGTLAGGKAANTYTSGAPVTPVLTTGQASWVLWGNCTASAANWPQVSNRSTNPQLGDLQYNSDFVVGHEDLYSFPALSTNSQNIYAVGVKACCERSDAGARTVNIQTKSSGTDSVGDTSGLSPPAAYGWVSSYYTQDPNGPVDWNSITLNAATSGVKIAS